MGMPVNPIWDQQDYAFYESNGTTIVGTAGTQQTLDVDTTYYVRLAIGDTNNANSTGIPADLTCNFQYNLASGGWNDVTTTTPLQFANGSLTDGASITSSTLTAIGTFNNGRVYESDSDATVVYTLPGDETDSYTEVMLGFTIDSAQVSDGQEILVRATFSGGTAYDNYTNADIDVNEAAAPITASGSLLSGNATIAATTTLGRTATGTLTSGDAAISGSASTSVNKTASGSLLSGNAQITGDATKQLNVTGALTSGDATITGSGTKTLNASGSLLSGDATITGSGVKTLNVTGALSAGNAQITGTTTLGRTASGSLLSEAAQITGLAGTGAGQTASGTLLSGNAAVSGSGVKTLNVTGSLQAGNASIAGDATKQLNATGALQSGDAQITGATTINRGASGSLQSAAATIAGAVAINFAVAGALAASTATITGSGTALPTGSGKTASGSLLAGNATVAGNVSNGLGYEGLSNVVHVPGVTVNPWRWAARLIDSKFDVSDALRRVSENGFTKPRYIVPWRVNVQTGGTPVGTVTDMQEMLDGNEYNLPEVSGVPGFDLELDFQDVDIIRGIVLRAYYSPEASTHYAELKIRDFANSTDVTLFRIPPSDEYELRTIMIPDSTNYVHESRVAQLTLYHPSTGNTSHDMYIDYVGIF